MKNKWIVLLALLALVLTGCGKEPAEQPPQTEQTPPQQEQPAPEKTEPAAPGGDSTLLERLNVELVVTWQDTDRILSSLEQMELLLQQALSAQGYEAEEVDLTVSTAGGVTADALVQGGIDAAFLPAEDYLTCEASVAAVLTGGEPVCRMVMAVGGDMDGALRQALERALLETEQGGELLDLYVPGQTLQPAREETLQALRDWAAQQEEDGHGT